MIDIRFHADGKPFADLLQYARRFDFPCDESASISVLYRGHDRWSVNDNGGSVLSKNGRWLSEPINSERSDAFLERTRFTLAEAVQHAVEICNESPRERECRY